MVARRSARRGGEGEGGGIDAGEAGSGENVGNAVDENPRDISPPDSPFFGFSNADIPQPILIKTEPLEVPEEGTGGIVDGGDGGDEDECVIVKVTRATKPLPQALIKMEKEDEDDVDIFHGFSLQELPRPIVIKEEAVEEEEEVLVERGESVVIPEYWVQQPEVPLGPVVPGDDLCDEFSEAVRAAEQQLATPEKLSPETEKKPSKEEPSDAAPMDILGSSVTLQEPVTASMEEKSVASPNPTRSPQRFARSPQRSLASPSR